MIPIGKDITKRNEIACSSTSYTLFVFYALMFAMSLLCHCLSHFCDIHVTRLNLRQDAITTEGLRLFLIKIPFISIFFL